ncbi:MAG TPA: DUF2760 domain-containing protein [Candidatus Binatia bacterium]|nr:DUF2760 domain-containing protein [Candidatus Binatia bacterium]
MSAGRVASVLVLALVVAGADWLAVADPLRACAPCLAWVVAGPFVLALLALAILRPAAPPPAAAPAPPPPDTPALDLLAALQDEGRLVDFLTEDIGTYSDAQVGAAVRGIQASCRKALEACVKLEPILRGAENEPVTVEAGFDPGAVRLTGNVTGRPPFRGVLRHAGWRVTGVTVPARQGCDARVIAPAEVELP